MGTFPRVNQIRRAGALTLLGNSQAVEGRAEDLTASEARIILGLATTSDVTFDIVRATTSVQTPLVNNAAAALTLGNSTYGVTVPGAIAASGNVSVTKATTATLSATSGTRTAYVDAWQGDNVYFRSVGSGCWVGTHDANELVLYTDSTRRVTVSSTGAATFSGDLLFNATNTYDIGNGTYDPRTVRAATSVLTPLVNNASAALTLGNATYGVTVPGKLSIGRSPSGATTALDVYNASASVHATIQSGNNFCELLLTSGSTAIPNYITSNGNLSFIVGGSERAVINQSTGTATFSGDVSMSKTSAQGYIYQYSPNGSQYLVSWANNAAESYIQSTGGLTLQSSGATVLLGSDLHLRPSVSGVSYVWRSGVNSTFSVYNTDGTKYTRLTNDGTNGILSTSSGNLQFDLGAAGGCFDFRGVAATNNIVRINNSLNTQNLSLQHNGRGIISTSSGALQLSSASTGIELKPAGGYLELYTPSANSKIWIFDGSGGSYTGLTHDGSNGILNVSSGNLNLVPTGGTVAVTGAGTYSSTVTATAHRITSAAHEWSFRGSAVASGSAAIYDETNAREPFRIAPTGTVTILNNLVVNGGTYGGAEAGVILQQSGVTKWQLYDASSTFRIYNATTAADAMTIAAATSNATFAGGITASGVGTISGTSGSPWLTVGSSGALSGSYDTAIRLISSNGGGAGSAIKWETSGGATIWNMYNYATTDLMIGPHAPAAAPMFKFSVSGTEGTFTAGSQNGTYQGKLVAWNYNYGTVTTGLHLINTENAGGGIQALFGVGDSGGTVREGGWIRCDKSAQTVGTVTTDLIFGTTNAGTTASEVLRLGSSGLATFAGGITASGNVSYSQGLSTGTVTKSANYTTTADDYCVNVTANSIDITFETAVGCANREHEVINSGSGVVTLKTTSAQTISGNASGALTLAQWKSIRVKSDGSNWLIMSQVT